jgi:hypothetical protein
LPIKFSERCIGIVGTGAGIADNLHVWADHDFQGEKAAKFGLQGIGPEGVPVEV